MPWLCSATTGRSVTPASPAPIANHQVHSIASILAIVAALASFFVNSGGLGLVLAIAAIVLGVVGFLMAASPRVSGGLLSLASIGLGVVAAVFALIRGVWHLI